MAFENYVYANFPKLMTTKLIHQLIPSAHKLERRYYRLVPVSRSNDKRLEHQLPEATYALLDVVLSLVDDLHTTATFSDIQAASNKSRAATARHLATLVKVGLLEVMPTQSRLVVMEDD